MSNLSNPYAPPKAQEPCADAATDLSLASKGQRLLNLVIDYLAQRALALAVGWALALAGVPLHLHVLTFTISSVFAVWIGYYVACELLFGCTLGKFVTRTRVVDESGNRPSFLQIVGRTFARLVPFEPFSCFDNPPIGWHDRWSGTRVVRLSKSLPVRAEAR
jgi:uncharacterized RDD family membrane protein YckC